MAVLALDHVNIRTADVPGTAAFFRDVLGLRAAPAPGVKTIEAACWIYDPADRPIIHIGPVRATYPSDGAHPFAAAHGGGAVHHVALECDDLAGMRERLAAGGHAYTLNDIPQIGLTQLFVAEANGILLELNFRG
ncbi:VOC family protein [Sphingomonas jatrophae]|uniref:Catechol 2,3-dioxygenase n=1 Tax=Sphingomonas jatrophae TaxID=1166337 RepID=A0A1I6KH36_9SPHN|nr:VOC family protein [Sphingomonas jatrophae]SFR90552.1 Catechol 2,3-dioxygenase [Sphingomonas jatrophae]